MVCRDATNFNTLPVCFLLSFISSLKSYTTDLRAELEDLDMEADDDDGGGGGGFVPLRDDAMQCFKEHDGKAGIMFGYVL